MTLPQLEGLEIDPCPSIRYDQTYAIVEFSPTNLSSAETVADEEVDDRCTADAVLFESRLEGISSKIQILRAKVYEAVDDLRAVTRSTEGDEPWDAASDSPGDTIQRMACGIEEWNRCHQPKNCHDEGHESVEEVQEELGLWCMLADNARDYLKSTLRAGGLDRLHTDLLRKSAANLYKARSRAQEWVGDYEGGGRKRSGCGEPSGV